MPERAGSPWPWSVNPEDKQRLHRNPAHPVPGHARPCPRAQRDVGSSNGLHPHADLHPHKLNFLFVKRPGSKRPMTTLRSPFLYLNISKHLAKTFIFSLPQGEEVIRENGTNIPICQKQEGSELKGKFYHLTVQNQPRRERKGLLCPSTPPSWLFPTPLREPRYGKDGSGPKPDFHFAENQSVAPAQGTDLLSLLLLS